MREIRTKLIGVDVKNPELIDPIRRIIEILGVGTVQISIEVKIEALGKKSLFNGLFGLLETKGEMREALGGRTRLTFGERITSRVQDD